MKMKMKWVYVCTLQCMCKLTGMQKCLVTIDIKIHTWGFHNHSEVVIGLDRLLEMAFFFLK